MAHLPDARHLRQLCPIELFHTLDFIEFFGGTKIALLLGMETKKIDGAIYTLILDEDLTSWAIGWQRGKKSGYTRYSTRYQAEAVWTRL